MVELNTWAGLEPAVMDIKTVSGLAQVFELTLTDSTGSVADLEGVTFRGAVNTAPLQELMCAVEGGKVLFGWSGLPAGRHSFDLFLVTGHVEKALVRGAFVVSGRVMPPLDQESYSVNHAATLVLPDTADGIILVELSEVGLVDLLSRKAGAFAEEARGHVSSVRELKEFIVQKVDGFGDVVETATKAITEAGKSAVESVESGRGEAVQAVKEAKETATTAITEAGKSAVESVESGRGEAVQAVKEAKETATTAITEAGKSAVASVESSRRAAVGTITPLVQEVETVKGAIDQAENRINAVGTDAENSATAAAKSATAAQQALEAMPQVDASGNMTLAGGLTAAGAVNANGGINIPLAVGAATDTSAVNRFLAMGLAGAVQALIQPLYLKTSSMPVVGSGSTSVQYVGLYATSSTSAASGSPAHSTTTFTFEGPQGQHNYSSFAGFSIPLSGSTASKFTFGLGRGSKTVRGGLTMDSFSMIPGNNLAVNYGEIIDITTTAVRDSVRGGYVLRVREIYYVSSGDSWQVKTTESFIPATQNHPFPACLNRLIFMQEGLSSMSSYEGKASLYIELGGGQTNTLFKIAALRGVSGFEDGMGFSTLVADVENPNSWTSSVRTGAGNRYLYANGLINPMYAALEAMAVNAIESEETADFEDINVPLES